MKERLRIYPGVESSKISQIIRSWVSAHRIGNLEIGFSDLMGVHFKQVPRLLTMIKFHGLVRAIVSVVKNGVLGHKCCKDAFQEMMLLQPGLVKTCKEKVLLFELSSGLRVLLTWYRSYAKAGKMRAKLVKRATANQRRILDSTIAGLVLKNRDDEEEAPKPHEDVKKECKDEVKKEEIDEDHKQEYDGQQIVKPEEMELQDGQIVKPEEMELQDGQIVKPEEMEQEDGQIVKPEEMEQEDGQQIVKHEEEMEQEDGQHIVKDGQHIVKHEKEFEQQDGQHIVKDGQHIVKHEEEFEQQDGQQIVKQEEEFEQQYGQHIVFGQHIVKYEQEFEQQDGQHIVKHEGFEESQHIVKHEVLPAWWHAFASAGMVSVAPCKVEIEDLELSHPR